MGKKLVLGCGLLLVVTLLRCLAQNQPQREIVITIDDLPAANARAMTGTEIVEMTAKLLGTLRDQKIPAVGFVNEKQLYKFGEVDDRIKALSLWLDAGLELGNHTFSHASLNRIALKDWEEEVVRGETVTRMLLAQHNMKLRYFRHPYLDVGRDLETRRQAEAFLAGRGYRIAPITMDAWDWMYAGVYEDARKRGDSALQQQLVSSYLSYTGQVFDYYEKFSRDLLGYEPPQIILLHGNWLEADHIAELLDLLRKRGYRFITLQAALSDAAYSMPDEFVAEEGTNWLDHWAITKGQPPRNTPVFPQWVMDRSEALPHAPAQP
ncbi:MAG TPA: polysaccharide deacetylase family protein [Terriglobales bacterium]|jgi:peptidoglycan/xylan/chitin deacetylase (PgdA/CDA1 family)|nr:polysaccharide deacetylase family protein [Terriglobales bacterium]